MNPSPIAVHRRLLLPLVSPIFPRSPFRFRDVGPQAQSLHLRQDLSTVIPLIGHHLFDPLGVDRKLPGRRGCRDLLRDRLPCGRQCLLDRFAVAGGSPLGGEVATIAPVTKSTACSAL